MAYRVKLTAPAEADAYGAFEWVSTNAPTRAQGWLEGLFRVVFSLQEMPERCPVIPESERVGRTLRQLLYGRRTGAYRIIFEVDHALCEVRVLRIWRASRDVLRPEDVDTEDR